MDFTPGYRLIHITELAEEKKNLDRILSDESNTENDLLMPLLANYSNDYICYYKSFADEERIWALMHDDGEWVLMHESPEKFLETICEFYKQGVYFLDSPPPRHAGAIERVKISPNPTLALKGY